LLTSYLGRSLTSALTAGVWVSGEWTNGSNSVLQPLFVSNSFVPGVFFRVNLDSEKRFAWNLESEIGIGRETWMNAGDTRGYFTFRVNKRVSNHLIFSTDYEYFSDGLGNTNSSKSHVLEIGFKLEH
jgi:hypothetical protein